jgi:hypothetical protein
LARRTRGLIDDEHVEIAKCRAHANLSDQRNSHEKQPWAASPATTDDGVRVDRRGRGEGESAISSPHSELAVCDRIGIGLTDDRAGVPALQILCTG